MNRRVPSIAAIGAVIVLCLYGAWKYYSAQNDAEAFYALMTYCRVGDGCHVWVDPDGSWHAARVKFVPAETPPAPQLPSMRF